MALHNNCLCVGLLLPVDRVTSKNNLVALSVWAEMIVCSTLTVHPGSWLLSRTALPHWLWGISLWAKPSSQFCWTPETNHVRLKGEKSPQVKSQLKQTLLKESKDPDSASGLLYMTLNCSFLICEMIYVGQYLSNVCKDLNHVEEFLFQWVSTKTREHAFNMSPSVDASRSRARFWRLLVLSLKFRSTLHLSMPP